MTDDQLSNLRQDTEDLFYHGFDNYMLYAYPEDELKPISCAPQTRNRDHPADIGLNDVLGNYSLTLVDSLSTLAILASKPRNREDKYDSLREFQEGVKNVVELYGDGTSAKRCGVRACGFDLDSKVQVFETNIRGVGGLLSAHLFATGELPIRGYSPVWKDAKKSPGIKWPNGFTYNRQLLDLAYDLAERLLPAFSTPTGIPYPRVNLRHGIPFYHDPDSGVCRADGKSSGPREITENCAAGAGSLVLEFATLSRLTGDMRFERLAKNAYRAIWERRSSVGLVGNGIDSETGQWTYPALSGIGAGIDSFFEYSLKSHILLSGLPYNVTEALDPSEEFLQVWQMSHSAVRRHIYKSDTQEKHPYYGQVDTMTGAPRYSWIDNLSAYYPGLLVLAGELDEAIESHLLFGALWTKYNALPERWNTANAFIDPHFKHWAGRPEFIESTFYIYQATRDPYYLHVGEMTLRDIRRRCWTKCGWADLGDVTTGEQRDRMESFFLGETAKYLYLLFTADHPLNQLDKPVVFTTEGHPLIIPDRLRSTNLGSRAQRTTAGPSGQFRAPAPVCPAVSSPLPLTVSNTANRHDFFHAAAVARLVSASPPYGAITLESAGDGIRTQANHTFYPWTLPIDLVPTNGMSSRIVTPAVSTLTFPDLGSIIAQAEQGAVPIGAVNKIVEGVVINSLSNLRLNMVQEPRILLLPDDSGIMMEEVIGDEFRIQGIANFPLGRDEKVVLSDEALKSVNPTDPHFLRIKDLEMVDLVLDAPTGSEELHTGITDVSNSTADSLWNEVTALVSEFLPGSASVEPGASPTAAQNIPSLTRYLIPAILPTGTGTAPLPAAMDSDPLALAARTGSLPFSTIFYLADPLCTRRLPSHIVKSYNIVVIERGGCSFNEKLANIPSFAPADNALQLVVVVSMPEYGEGGLIRPLLDQEQLTPNGFVRRYPIAMVMVDGTPETIGGLKAAAAAIARFDDRGKMVEANMGTVGGALGVKRRYWFESMGIPIANLVMA